MNLTNLANIFSQNVYETASNAYFYYEQNPNNKYTYVKIESGPGIEELIGQASRLEMNPLFLINSEVKNDLQQQKV